MNHNMNMKVLHAHTNLLNSALAVGFIKISIVNKNFHFYLSLDDANLVIESRVECVIRRFGVCVQNLVVL